MQTTENAFLGGRLHILQPKDGYRAGADPVLLAAAVEAKPGQSVLDLGCGVGTAMLCLSSRVTNLAVTGVELQPELVQLAQSNLERNKITGAVLQGDIRAFRDQTFDHVMTNPPYFDRSAGNEADEPGREQGRGESMDLAIWIDCAIRRLKPGGRLTMINRIERLPDCLAALGGRVGDVRLLPLAPRLGRCAKLFLLRARKGSKGAFVLLPPFVLHSGEKHSVDGDDYSPQAQAILRQGRALPLTN